MKWVAGSARSLQAILLITSAVVAYALVAPRPIWKPPAFEPVSSQAVVAKPVEKPLDLSIVWTRNLRQPMVDPPAPVAAAAAENPPPFQLAGTAVEDDRRFAIFAMPGDRSVLREGGAVLEGFEIASIERGLVRLRRGGKSFELRVPWYERLVAGLTESEETRP